MTTEIERKFLVDSMPVGTDIDGGTAIRQGYVAEDGEVEVRVRITPSASTITIKAGRGLSRTEVEMIVDAGRAEALWPFTVGRRIEKVRRRLTLAAGDVVEIDVYGGDLAGLVVAEIEFASTVAAAAFQPPTWLGRELTGDAAWSNAALSRHGRPQG